MAFSRPCRSPFQVERYMQRVALHLVFDSTMSLSNIILPIFIMIESRVLQDFTSHYSNFLDFRFQNFINKISGRVDEIWQQLVTPCCCTIVPCIMYICMVVLRTRIVKETSEVLGKIRFQNLPILEVGELIGLLRSSHKVIKNTGTV